MINRRQFLSGGSIIGGGILLEGCGASRLQNPAKQYRSTPMKQSAPMIKPGIQLYTLRYEMSKSPGAVIKALSKIGYQEVELAGVPDNMSAAAFRTLLDENEITCPAIHLQGPVASQVRIAEELGATLVVLPVPMPLLNEQWQLRSDVTLDDFRRFAETLNQMGADAKRSGFQFGYHNHAWEMAVLDDQLAYEVLLNETDPDLVFMELDLGWAYVGKVDAIELIENYPGRFKTCHVKDFNAAGDIVNAGEGIVPLSSHLLQRRAAGLQHFFIEHDDTKDGLESAREGYEYLTSLSNI